MIPIIIEGNKVHIKNLYVKLARGPGFPEKLAEFLSKPPMMATIPFKST